MARSNAINLNESRVISWIRLFDYHFDSFDCIYVIIVTVLMIMYLKMGSFSVGSVWISDFGTWIFGLGKLNVVFAKLRLALELFCVGLWHKKWYLFLKVRLFWTGRAALGENVLREVREIPTHQS